MKQRTGVVDYLVAIILMIGVGTFFLWGIWIKETLSLFKNNRYENSNSGTPEMKASRSWIEINKKALLHNAGLFRKIVGEKTLLMAVVKSNAYGHGLVECARLLGGRTATSGTTAGNVDWFGVDDIDEALELRKAGIKKPILVLGYTLPEFYVQAAKNNISITISSIETLKHLLRIEKCKLKIHLKLETGLNRQGITEEVLGVSCQVLGKLKDKVILEGIYSHFAAAELVDHGRYRDYCDKQMDRFEYMYEFIILNLVPNTYNLVPMRHMAGTAATLLLPRSRYDLVRVGIGMYGLDPGSISPKSEARNPKQIQIIKGLDLKAVMSWYSIVAQVKDVKKGERVGYNLTERLARDGKLAVVPVGYWHGYPRALSNKGLVLVHNKPCKVVGRICMDMMIIDVTNVPKVKQGDVVTLIGEGLSAELVATKADTINYELVTRINQLLPRIYN